MGFLRVRKIKNCQYFYWSTRTRSSKKHGGSGKVRSTELLIGRYFNGRYLSFYLWSKEIPIEEYAKAVIAYSCPESWCSRVAVVIDWRKKAKVTFKAFKNAPGRPADCRSSFWRKQKSCLQEHLDAIVYCGDEVTENIEWAAFFLARYEYWKKEAAESRTQAVEIRKDPLKEWTELESLKDPMTGYYCQKEVEYVWKENADSAFDEEAAEAERKADLFIENYQKILDVTVKLAPLKRQKEFQTLALRQIKKLASDARWVEAFERKNCTR